MRVIQTGRHVPEARSNSEIWCGRRVSSIHVPAREEIFSGENGVPDDMNCAEAHMSDFLISFEAVAILEEATKVKNENKVEWGLHLTYVDMKDYVVTLPRAHHSVAILEEAAKVKNENKIEWGIDLAYDSRYFTKEKVNASVIVYNHPKASKDFYMKVGELIGGSQREENYEVLKQRYLTEEKFKASVIVYNHPKASKDFYMKVNEDNEIVASMDVLVLKVGSLLAEAEEKRIMRFSSKGKKNFVNMISIENHRDN
ncbi:Asparagine--tRNA ligase, cytoplasmic 3 [Sesamum angolense]|uniref:Asparagine--tRNA ligase, cytoplasmic 3 n=1 Tax=Sesamum angolense TaxID=2727404 RepID=A0AAE1T8S6_9LAMI|nr:Asparagine--tRNA ligase, cytoplasmic 3 [Sesamum angolense]